MSFPLKAPKISQKYKLYEAAVQSPKLHVQIFEMMVGELRAGKPTRTLREDFCGTAQIAAEWTRRNPENTSIGLDLDPEPLAYGKENHLSKLKPSERKRVTLFQADVISVTKPGVDLCIACNFSFYCFKDRAVLLKYFKAVHASLTPGGVFILEMVGGAGFTTPGRETRTIEKSKAGSTKYVWHQKKYDPITNEGLYAIHFELPGKKKIKDLFIYDWRIWSISEVRDILKEAGFSRSVVYWEDEDEESDNGGYIQREHGSNDYVWGALLAGVK